MPPLSAILKLAEYFNVTIDYLLGITSSNDSEVAWSQKIKWKRIKLFENPDGELIFEYFHNGVSNVSRFSYSFGILPLENIDFRPTFLFLDEIEGEYLKFVTEFETLKKQTSLSENHRKIYDEAYSKSNLAFLALIGFLNETLCLGYRIHPESNGMHRINLITPIDNGVSCMPIYGEIKSMSGKPVKVAEIFGGYSSFLNSYYLPLSVNEKVDFLSKYRDEAFTW